MFDAKIRNVSQISTYFVVFLRLLRYFCFHGQVIANDISCAQNAKKNPCVVQGLFYTKSIRLPKAFAMAANVSSPTL
jgi:hypothetical protein